MSDTIRLLLALLDIAPEMERLLGAEWPRVRDELLVLAGGLDREDDARAISRDLDALLERLLTDAPPERQELVRRAMQKALAAESDEAVTRGGIAIGAAAQSSAEEIGGVLTIPVFYGTIAPTATTTLPRTTTPASAARPHSALLTSAFPRNIAMSANSRDRPGGVSNSSRIPQSISS